MRLATVRTGSGGGGTATATAAARLEGDSLVLLDAPDVGALLRDPRWRDIAAGDGERRPADAADHAPLVVHPGKVLCVGLNYRDHITEMGRPIPEYPTLFAKYPEALLGANDPIVLPDDSPCVDWEAELAVVIGSPVRRATPDTAAAAIAGFTVLNDVTMRDWQYRTPMWLQGKTFEGSSPVGPVLVTPDELPGGVHPKLELTCHVDGEQVQRDNTSRLVFSAVDLIEYTSRILTLQPGDVISTGTPGGVGHSRVPPRYLQAGMSMVTEIEGIGRLTNPVVAG
jgi:acylpyruvate hydrolase